MKKSAIITIGSTKALVLDTKTTLTSVEAELEISYLEERGNARLKIWGPRKDGKPKECTVQVSKIGSHTSRAVYLLSTYIISPLLDHLLVNVDAKDLLKNSQSIPTKNGRRLEYLYSVVSHQLIFM